MNVGVSEPLLSRSSTSAVGKQCAAQTRPEVDVMVPYLVLTACAAFGLLMCAQEVAPAPNPWSSQRYLRLADRLGPAGHPGARRTRRRNDLAVPQSHAVG